MSNISREDRLFLRRQSVGFIYCRSPMLRERSDGQGMVHAWVTGQSLAWQVDAVHHAIGFIKRRILSARVLRERVNARTIPIHFPYHSIERDAILCPADKIIDVSAVMTIAFAPDGFAFTTDTFSRNSHFTPFDINLTLDPHWWLLMLRGRQST